MQIARCKNSHKDVNYIVGNIVNSIVTMVPHGYQIYWDDHFIKYINVQSVCCTSESNTILDVNCDGKHKCF